jgi:hypothetical protein
VPLFSDPDQRQTPKTALVAVLQSGGLWLGMVGWFMVAIALSKGGPIFGVAVIGLIASAFAKRAFIVSLVVEIAAFSLAGALCPPEATDWLWTGGLCFALGRGVWLALRKWERD